jgi:membrane-associated phospholipid phosphatase
MTGAERAWAAVGVAALAGGAALLAAARGAGPLWGEDEAVRWMQGQPGSVTVARVIRWLTSTEPVTAAGLLAAATARMRGATRLAMVTAVLFFALPLVQTGLKEVATRPRPEPPAVELRAGFSSPSFPAGHAMSGMVGYGWAWAVAARSPLPRAARRCVGAACAGVIAGTAWANLWTGVHWPTDIAGGFAWGVALLALAALAWRPGRRPARDGAS